MKAARVLRFGPPNVITNDDLPQPEPSAGQLLVRVKAAGVGHWDALIREEQGNTPTPASDSRRPSSRESSKVSEWTFRDSSSATKSTGPRTSSSAGPMRNMRSPSARRMAPKTEDLELHRGSVGSDCHGHGLADAVRVCPRHRRADRARPWRCGQRVARTPCQLAKQAGFMSSQPLGSADLDYVRGLGAETVVDHKTGAIRAVRGWRGCCP